LLVRSDADTRQGTGHVMRSLALAREWRARGGSLRFATAGAPPELSRRMQLAGAIVLDIAQPYPDGADLDSTVRYLERMQSCAQCAAWALIDGYHFDETYQSRLRHAGCRLLVIDDNAHLPRYRADIILNHGVQAPMLDYRDSADAWFLLGTRYALLRGEFDRWRNFTRAVPEKAKNILVTLGGGDADNVTDKVIGALQKLEAHDLEIQVLVGALNPHLGGLRQAVAASQKIRLRTDVTDPAPLMAWADIAIAAGGTTAWELAFMQAPTLLLVLAENQLAVAQGVDEFGAAHSLGWADRITRAELADGLHELISDRERRRLMATQGRILVDGRGIERVLNAIEAREHFDGAGDFWLRPANADDKLLLWQWANDPATRRHSFNPEPIPWSVHENWYGKKIASADCRIWIMQIGALPVGQIRYERVNGDTAEISLSIARGFRGMQLGTRLLEASAERALRELGVRSLQGAVRIGNEASRRAFLKAGFECSKEETTHGIPCWIFRRSVQGSSWREDHVAVH
jgi:UDP-2,4-diacetamido-2,4,6-trideoxy-beta-L-altropyranose hydrolase